MTSRRVRWERMGPVRWSVWSNGAIVVVEGRLDPSEAPSVGAALHARLSRAGGGTVICHGEGLVDPDLATVDLLARLHLAAHRSGYVVRVEDPSRRLRQLLVLAGLDDLLVPCRRGVEARRQAEQREQPCGVEKGVESDDRST